MQVIGLLFLVIALGLVLSICNFACSVSKGVITKVVTPDNIVYNYQWFYDMKGEIDATRQKYFIAKGANKEESVGIAMVLESMVQEYNSKSRQMTRNMWKAKDLPYQIESGI